MLERSQMIYSIIPAQYVITLEYCYVQMSSCKFFLDKIRNELADEIGDANTDKAALYYAKHINNLTRILTGIDELIEVMDDYMRRDLVNILIEKRVWEDTIWCKNINKTRCGYKVIDICLDNINTLKLQVCDILNKDFDLGIACEDRDLDGTLNVNCLDN